MTLSDFIFNLYWPTVRPSLRPEWADTIERYHLRVIAEGLGTKLLSELSPEVCRQWWNDRAATLKRGIARKIFFTFRHLLRCAVSWGHLQRDPLVGVRPPLVGRPRSKFFNSAERGTLLAKANPRLRPYLILASYTGSRRRSLLELKWEQVDFKAETLTFLRTKSGYDHTIPIHPELLVHLRTWKREARTPYVLPRYKPASLSRAFKRLAKRVGLGDARLHDMRHDVASRLLKSGTSLAVIQAILGHLDIRSTARYTHADEAMIKTALGKGLSV